MAFAWDVADHFALVGETHLGDLAKRRVRLLRGRGVDARAHATLLRVCFHRRHFGTCLLRIATLADQLVNRRHEALHLFQVTLLMRPASNTQKHRLPTGPPGHHTQSAMFNPSKHIPRPTPRRTTTPNP